MNIKQAETASGVSRRNIRFYEQKGLIGPVRNRENDYREYSDGDIDRLKTIRMLRMVDMPIEQIQRVLDGKQDLAAAAAEQKQRLKTRKETLETAIRFCEELEAAKECNVEDTLMRMNSPESQRGLFTQWMQDYRRFAQAQREAVFTFIPDTAVTNPAEFTLALCEYGTENKLDLVVTKEGMYPEFTIDGVEYTAERIYTSVCRVPTAVIRCTALHPEQWKVAQPKWKKALLTIAHYGWIVLLLLLVNSRLFFSVDWRELVQSWEGWLIILTILVLAAVDIYRWLLLRYNEHIT